jgi:hypothetical protein
MRAALCVRILVIACTCMAGLTWSSQLLAQHDSPDFIPRTWADPEPGSVDKRAITEPPSHLVAVRISAETLAGLIDRTIDVTAPVKDVILGTPITGVARIVGQPRVELSPSADKASFNVVVKGTVYSKTLGHSDRATIRGHSITHFTATKEVTYEPGVGFRSYPPTVAACTECFTDEIIPSRGGIVGRITQRRAHEQISAKRAQLTAIARERATRRIETAFERKLNERIVKLNQAVAFQVQLASMRKAEDARRIVARTTAKFLELSDALESNATVIDLPVRQSTSDSSPSIEIWVRSSLIPEKLGDVLQTVFTNPDQLAVLNALAVLPGTLGKEAATLVTSLASENKVGLQTCGEWLVIDLNIAPKTAIAAKTATESAGATRR